MKVRDFIIFYTLKVDIVNISDFNHGNRRKKFPSVLMHHFDSQLMYISINENVL